MEIITSTKNKCVKEVQALHKSRGRKKTKQFLLEGWHLVSEAHQAGVVFHHVFVEEKSLEKAKEQFGNQSYTVVSSNVLKAMASTPTPQGIIAIASWIEQPNIETIQGAILVLDRVQDPGNVGTMIRTADAAGYQAVILSEDSADLYNPKVMRSTQGSLYHLPVIYTNLESWIQSFKTKGGKVYGTALDKNAIDYRTITPTGNFAVLMGNEGQGVSPLLLNQTTQNVYIPMRGQAESLNVAVATGILLFQWQ